MYRVIVLYEAEPDTESYAEHAALCEAVPNSVFRHGKIFGGPMGEPAHKYYAEWEFADKDAFKAATPSRVCPSTIRADGAARLMSASSATASPAPTAGPSIAATIGLRQSTML